MIKNRSLLALVRNVLLFLKRLHNLCFFIFIYLFFFSIDDLK